MERALDPLNVLRAWRHAGSSGPPLDMYETSEAVMIRLAVPGADGGSLSLNIGEETLTVRGESALPGARWSDRTVVHWQEIPYGRFERTVPLPVPVNSRGCRAQYRNGILEITLPKARGTDSRSIPIAFA